MQLLGDDVVGDDDESLEAWLNSHGCAASGISVIGQFAPGDTVVVEGDVTMPVIEPAVEAVAADPRVGLAYAPPAVVDLRGDAAQQAIEPRYRSDIEAVHRYRALARIEGRFALDIELLRIEVRF